MLPIRIISLFLIVLLLISLSACSKSPETAHKELGQMNIDYTDDSFFNYVERGDKVVVELFLTAGKSSNLRNKYGASILYAAAVKGHDEIVKLLIAKGADVNAKARHGWTPLMAAAVLLHDNPELVKILINKGADINAEVTEGNYRGETPLTLAVDKKKEYQNPELVKVMLSKGSANDKNMREALLRAKRIGYTEAADILKKAGAEE